MSVVLNELRCPMCGKFYAIRPGQKEVGCPKCLEERATAQGHDDQRLAEMVATSGGAPWSAFDGPKRREP